MSPEFIYCVGDNAGTKGHPECQFCYETSTQSWQRFYDDSALWIHLKKKHYNCFLCEAEGILHRYYEDYARLEEHFRDEHFLCESPFCLSKRFCVFADPSGLKVHQLASNCTEGVQGVKISVKKKKTKGKQNLLVGVAESNTFLSHPRKDPSNHF